MNSSRTAKKLAHELQVFAADNKDESTRGAATSLGRFSQLLGEAPQLAEVLAHPALSREGQEELLQEAGSDLSPHALACVQTLCDARALDLLPDIAAELARLADEEEGIAEARITTARPMDEGLRQRVIQALEKSLGKKIRLVETTDEGLLGGIQIEVQDNIFDGSIRGQLEAMREELSAA